MGVNWRYGPLGYCIDDTCSLYIVEMPARFDDVIHMQWALITRHVPNYKAKKVSGPFPTLEAAKAAYLVLAPKYPYP